MAKKPTPQQEAIRRAMNQPDRKWFVSRSMFWFDWGEFEFFTDYNLVCMAWGKPMPKFHSDECPETAWTVSFRFWKPMLIVFKHLDRKIWLGDWAWKKGL